MRIENGQRFFSVLLRQIFLSVFQVCTGEIVVCITELGVRRHNELEHFNPGFHVAVAHEILTWMLAVILGTIAPVRPSFALLLTAARSDQHEQEYATR